MTTQLYVAHRCRPIPGPENGPVSGARKTAGGREALGTHLSQLRYDENGMEKDSRAGLLFIIIKMAWKGIPALEPFPLLLIRRNVQFCAGIPEIVAGKTPAWLEIPAQSRAPFRGVLEDVVFLVFLVNECHARCHARFAHWYFVKRWYRYMLLPLMWPSKKRSFLCISVIFLFRLLSRALCTP